MSMIPEVNSNHTRVEIYIIKLLIIKKFILGYLNVYLLLFVFIGGLQNCSTLDLRFIKIL